MFARNNPLSRTRFARYSAFEKGAGGDDCSPSSSNPDLVVQVVMISESIRLQAILNTYGIVTQTPDELEPVEVWSQAQMVKVYQLLGSSPALGLRGRPHRGAIQQAFRI